jgi:DGQHR domain-containing protein
LTDKGAALNERIWKLFEKAGFETKPNSNDASEETVALVSEKKRTIDLSAVDKQLGVKIIGSNKAQKKLRESFTTHIHDYEKLKELANANTVLFVSTEKEIEDKEREYAKTVGMRIWGEEELQYYEAVVAAIGKFAKYEIIHSFGLETTEEKTIHHVLALKFNQPHADSSTELFLFTISPEKLLKTCVIYRRAQGSGAAYQRMVRADRLAQIHKFVTQNDAILPPNIIVHFSDKVAWDPVKIPETDAGGIQMTLTREKDYQLVLLKIPMEYASLELIDGQHRLYGFSRAEPSTRDNFNLVTLGIKNLSNERRRDTFVAINDNSRRMDPNLVAYLKYTDEESECQKDNELMAIKVVVELNKTSPFKKKIRLLDVGNQKLTLKGFCGYDLKGLMGRRGLLRKYYDNKSDEYIRVLRMYYSMLKSVFSKQWADQERYIIFTNSGVSAFLKLLRSMLATNQRPLSARTIKKYLWPLRNKFKDSDWETEKLAQTLRTTYVGSKGWKDLHRLLVKTIREVYPDFKE